MAMYATQFAYQAPASLDEALRLLREPSDHGDVKVLAGGQSLIPLLKLRLTDVGLLIDLRRIAELRGISEESDALVIGSMTPYVEIATSQLVARRCPLLVEAVRQVGDPQVRARGTVGGSLAHADAAGDVPAVAVALDAEVRMVGPNGTRSMRAADFLLDVMTTALSPDEIVTAIRFPAVEGPGVGTAYLKHRHPASGYAVVAVAAVIRLAADGTCQSAQLGITGAGTHATRLTQVERALAGRQLDDASARDASATAADGLELMGDAYASSEYRAHLARVLTARAVLRAAEHARQATGA
jgi:aerobic carbon-monoxide dehydrogenase medium subunit